MKSCSYCGAEYADEVAVCPVDQTPLGDGPAVNDSAVIRRKFLRLLVRSAMGLAAIVFVLFAIAFSSALSHSFKISGWTVSRKFYAAARLKIVENDPHNYYNISLWQTRYSAITNLLTSPEFRRSLTSAAKTDGKFFALDSVYPVRGTRLLSIDYYGVETNMVQSVASIVANMVVSFINTNYPSWEATYIDLYPYSVNQNSFWWQLHSELRRSWWWSF